MSIPLHDDYLFCGPALVNRLREMLSAADAPLVPAEDVLHIEQLSQAIANMGTRSPVVFVLWDGEGMGSGRQESQYGAARIMHQYWTVMLYVRSASQVIPDARHITAGPLMSRIHMAIAGWKPSGAVQPFHRASPGKRPQYMTNGAMYPLTFSIDLHY